LLSLTTSLSVKYSYYACIDMEDSDESFNYAKAFEIGWKTFSKVLGYMY